MNVHVFNIGSICIHGKELFRQFTFHQNTGKDLTLKQMFDTSEKLTVEQSDEIFGVSQISCEILHGNNYLWSMMKKSLVSRAQMCSYFQILCYVLER